MKQSNIQKNTSLEQIEQLAKDLSDRLNTLSCRVSAMQRDIELIRNKRLSGIKSAVRHAKDAEAVLRAAIENSPGLFVKPKTITIHGIKFGYQKQKGTIDIGDKDRLVARIENKMPDRFDDLVKTEYKPVLKAIANLDANDLKAIGVTISNTDDSIIIKATDSDVDKLVKALLDEDEANQ